MQDNKIKLFPELCVVSIFVLAGCGTSVSVKKIDDKGQGIPYYLPKPYLLITSGISTVDYKPKITETKTEKLDGTKSYKKVSEQVPVKSGTDMGYSVKIIPDLACITSDSC